MIAICSKTKALLIILLTNLNENYAQPSAVVSPRGYNASLDPEASFTFQCNVTGADTIRWVIDGLPSTRPEIRSRGISEGDIVVANATTGRFRGNISIERNFMNENTSVICIADMTFSAGVFSEPILFKIQGLLDAPSNLMLSEADHDNQHVFMRRLGWDKPFSLDITDIDPDVSHYKVCYWLVNATVEKSWCKRLTQTEYNFPFVNIPLCFTVSAVNIVGEGNSSTILHDASNCNSAKGDKQGEEGLETHMQITMTSSHRPRCVSQKQPFTSDI